MSASRPTNSRHSSKCGPKWQFAAALRASFGGAAPRLSRASTTQTLTTWRRPIDYPVAHPFPLQPSDVVTSGESSMSGISRRDFGGIAGAFAAYALTIGKAGAFTLPIRPRKYPIDAKVSTTAQRTVLPGPTPSTKIRPDAVAQYKQYGYGAWRYGSPLKYEADRRPACDVHRRRCHERREIAAILHNQRHPYLR